MHRSGQLWRLSLTTGSEAIPGISTSIGVEAAPADGVEAQRLLQIADQRLYEAKQAGRGRLVASDESA